MARNVQLLKKNGRVIPQQDNGCGTISLAMILNSFEVHKTGDPQRYSQEDIDREIRQADVFTAPVSVADLARSFGVAARLCNNADFSLMQRMVERNNVCQLICDAPNNTPGNRIDALVHYIVVDWAWEGLRSDFEAGMDDARHFAYNPGDHGRWLRVKDPQGNTYIIRFEDLETNYWKDMYFKALPTGLSNFMIVYAETENELDFSGYHTFNASAALVITTNSSELVTALVHTAQLYPSGFPRVIKNCVETILGAAAALIRTPGALLNKASTEGIELGKEMITKDTNLLKATAGVLVTGVSGTLWVASKPVEWLGDGFGYIVDIFD